MPTYEYECTRCNLVFEEFQNITDKPLQRCPKCKGKLRRLISGGVGIIFKGSGFYITDYKKSNLPQKVEKKSKEMTKTPDKSGDSTTKSQESPVKTSDKTNK